MLLTALVSRMARKSGGERGQDSCLDASRSLTAYDRGTKGVTAVPLNMLRRLFLLIAFAVPGICTVLGLLPGSKRKNITASSIKLKDGRTLAYELRGRSNARHVAFWNHGIISSRLEVSSTNLDVLEELDILLVGIDRPSYGSSDPHPNRSYESYVDDLRQLADSLGVRQFFVIGVSGGGPYTYAAAAMLPERVLGAMTISTVAQAGTMNAEEDQKFFREMDKVGEVVGRLFRRHNYMARVLRDVSLTWWGGRLLYSLFLQPVAANCLSLMADVDRNCVTDVHPEYVTRVVLESLRQRTAATFFQDLWLFERPWSFNLADIPAATQQSIHIWHGTGDKQVPWVSAKVLHRLMPQAHLHIVEGGGHFAYYACTKQSQRSALKQLLDSGRAPKQQLPDTVTINAVH